MIDIDADAFQEQFTGAYRAIEDRDTRWGAVRWFARQCGVNETTVWTWLRQGRAPGSAVKKVAHLRDRARDIAQKRHEAEQAAAARKLEETEALVK